MPPVPTSYMNCFSFFIRSLPMKNHHEVGHFKSRLMIVLLSLFAILVMAGQSLAATGCSFCHGMPPIDSADGSRQPSTGAFNGSHQKHVGANASSEACTKCHGNSASNYNSTHAATNSYKIQMNSDINNSKGLIATYSKTAPFAQSPNPTMQSCSNVNCHYEKPTALWGSTAVDCNTCHDAQQATANHSKHLASFAYNQGSYQAITCSTCHPNYTGFSHATSAGNHPIKVNMTNNYGGIGVTNISWLPSQLPKTYGSCSTVYCHSNGNGNFISQIYINPNWGSQPMAGCNLCHPTLSSGHTKHVGSLPSEIAFYNYTRTTSNGTDYKFGCANCHPLTVSSHINNIVEVVLTQNGSGGHLKNLNLAGATINAGKCSNIYCHSNGYLSGTFKCATSLAWTDKFDNYTALSKGRKDKCAWCHGNSPNTSPTTMPGSAAHTAHTVGIHYDDIYNGVSKKLILSGGQTVNAAHGRGNRSTTINCNICHAATVSAPMNDFSAQCSGCHKGPAATQGLAAISETKNHVNGKVDVAFIGQKIATKAQVATSAFAAYTAVTSGGWSRNSRNLPFKTYTSSYDVTKATLAFVAGWSQASGCSNVACHANITVKWTDAVTCTSCHTRLK
jgi:predicted CxxxxCH...CXXCH cytochrome family protein